MEERSRRRVRDLVTQMALDCPFDDVLDRYPDKFTVYALPDDAKAAIAKADWTDLPKMGVNLGTVSLDQIAFDDTKRRYISRAVIMRVRG
jgi:hypothetical protein